MRANRYRTVAKPSLVAWWAKRTMPTGDWKRGLLTEVVSAACLFTSMWSWARTPCAVTRSPKACRVRAETLTQEPAA